MGSCSDDIEQRPSCLIFLYTRITLCLTSTPKFTHDTCEILSSLSRRIYIIHSILSYLEEYKLRFYSWVKILFTEFTALYKAQKNA